MLIAAGNRLIVINCAHGDVVKPRRRPRKDGARRRGIRSFVVLSVFILLEVR